MINHLMRIYNDKSLNKNKIEIKWKKFLNFK